MATVSVAKNTGIIDAMHMLACNMVHMLACSAVNSTCGPIGYACRDLWLILCMYILAGAISKIVFLV